MISPDQAEIDRFRNAFELNDGFAFHVIVTPTREDLLSALQKLPVMTLVQSKPTSEPLEAKKVLEGIDRGLILAQGGPVLIDALNAHEQNAWRQVLGRLNELRNGIAQRHAGLFILAVVPEGETLLAHAAPDLWSQRRSGMRLGRGVKSEKYLHEVSKFEPPSDPRDFEQLCFEVFRKHWGDSGTFKGARAGQPQAGIDIAGKTSGLSWTGAVCRKEDGSLFKVPSAKEIESAIERAKRFRPTLEALVIATTGPASRSLRELARRYSTSSGMRVQIWTWPDFEKALTAARQ